jgi:hypothetical protein
MKKFISSLVLTLMFFVSFVGTAGNDRPISEIHSMMIYNFVKYIQWPDYDVSQDFVIGVIGEDAVYNTLKTWYDGKLRGDKKFSVKKYNSVADISKSHIIYIGKNEAKSFEAIHNRIKDFSTLTITDYPGLGAKGSAINFKTVNDKLLFELNQKAIDESKLKVSSQLSAMAILI